MPKHIEARLEKYAGPRKGVKRRRKIKGPWTQERKNAYKYGGLTNIKKRMKRKATRGRR